MALYHRCHYNSSGRLFDVRLGKDGSAVCDGPNPAQWTGASWNRGAPLGGERERAYIAFFTLISRKHTDSPPKAHGESCPCGESVLCDVKVACMSVSVFIKSKGKSECHSVT